MTANLELFGRPPSNQLPASIGQQISPIPLPVQVGKGRVLWFDRLSWSTGVRGVLTLGWRFKREIFTDPWSVRFNHFKFGPHESVVRAAAAVSFAALNDIHLPKRVISFTAALPAQGTVLDPRSRVARLTMRLAWRLGRPWCGDILQKEPHLSLHSRPRRAMERTRSVHGTYHCTRDPQCDLLIVCDDFVTTGDTLTEIARAVHARNAAVEIIGFALAKTECRTFALSHGQKLDNTHLPTDWANLWDRNVHP